MALVAQLRRNLPLHPLQWHDYCTAADTRERIAALSGISRASRHAIVSIQRFLPCFPPAISAEIMQFVQQLQFI